MTRLDHFIIKVDDLETSQDFYTSILGFEHEGTDGPFTVLRVNPELQVLLDPCGVRGSEHYAFALSRPGFERVFRHLESAGVPYGGGPDSVGTGTGPGRESGARGVAKTVYFHDPSGHLLEIRCYDA